MIKVKIYAPVFCSFKNLDERGWAELPDGAKLKDALRIIKMPRVLGKLLFAAVNGEKMPLDTKLNDGDIVGFFSLITGG